MTEIDESIDIPESEIRQELTRVLQSPVFSQSERLSQFLRFAIENALNNQSEALKEYVIGTEVYGRRPPYDPKHDSIVRSEARRLRSKLKQYYESDGRVDPVLIYFRLGSYVPVFRRQKESSRTASAQFSLNGDIFTEGRGESFAVIPLKDLSDTPTSSACAAALTDEIVHNMTRSEGICVASTGSSQVYEQYGSDLPMLAQKLGVRRFLQGSVQQEGQRLRVTIQCVKADGFQIFSQHIEAEPQSDEIFMISDHIARSLDDRFRPKSSFVRRRQASIGSGIIDNLTALFRSEAFIDEGTVTDVEMQIARLDQLTQETPGFADPICNVAECWYELALRGAVVSAKAIAEAKNKALQANELDLEMAHPLGCTAALLGLEWNWKAAEETFERALRLSPQSATYRQYAMLLVAEGRFDEARYHLQKAQDLNPFSHRQRTAWARFLALSRNCAELDHHASQRVLYGSLPLETQLYSALCHCALGRRIEAMTIVEENRKHAGGHPTIAALLVDISARCGAITLAHELIQRFHLLSPQAGISRFRQALLATALSDLAAAFAFLTAATDERDPECIWLSVEPRLDPLRHDPRFAALVERVTIDG